MLLMHVAASLLWLVMMTRRVCLLVIVGIAVIGGRGLCLAIEATDSDGIFRQYPFGDPRNCLRSEAVRTTQDDIPLNIMQVLPGIGWDNLRNVDAGYVMELNYSRCQTTGDRRYLIQDNVYAIPIQHSTIATGIEEHNSYGVEYIHATKLIKVCSHVL